MSPHAELLVNPAAGRGGGARAVSVLESLARKAGIRHVVTGSLEELRAEAHRAAHEDFVRRLLVAGGDGTFHHVVQQIAGSDTILGVIPVGSGNDLAASVGAPRDPRAAFEAALTAEARGIDLGRAGGRLFAVYCGLGLDGAVAEFNNRKVKRLSGSVAYVYSLVRVLASFEPPTLVIEHEHGRFEGQCFLAVAANGPRFGGGMRLAPDALMDDGALDLVFVEAIPKLELLKVFPRVYRGRHLDHPAVHSLRTRWVRIQSDRPLTPWGDGEPMTDSPSRAAEIGVARRRLWVAAPAAASRSQSTSKLTP